MLKTTWITLVVLIGLVVGSVQGATEARVHVLLDWDSTEESHVGVMGSVGVQPADRLSVGVYGSLLPTDRDLPAQMDMMYGLGVYAEYDITEGYALMPYVGMRAGLIETDGPSYPTAFHAVALLGLRYSISDVLAITGSLDFHWASKDLFDYERTGIAYTVDDTDLTLNIGVRYLFW